ncbi:hypothetical protein Sarmat_00380 [Rickettsiales endosymbiont of Paramecium tredecaurelia]|uniref:hypothetical protein n=1 Tax=Candidatus Sarmatiella mevalonica TaxID=2770581 RepID=UPI001921C471|nr:hypothetical protein [Candidatus Sarmatiella mevalonica]MBL3284532.1 hypothetical protein [Candidatus Sarmatiella mevalonica]
MSKINFPTCALYKAVSAGVATYQCAVTKNPATCVGAVVTVGAALEDTCTKEWIEFAGDSVKQKSSSGGCQLI